VRTQEFVLRIVNVSGEPGLAATIAVRLEEAGYIVDEIEPEFGESRKTSAVVASPEVIETAQSISGLLNNTLVSFGPAASSTGSDESEITIFVGHDLSQ
jgi:hypothetical protein